MELSSLKNFIKEEAGSIKFKIWQNVILIFPETLQFNTENSGSFVEKH